MITKEILQREIANLKSQKDNSFAVMHQAVGAIRLAEGLITLLDGENKDTAENVEQFPAQNNESKESGGVSSAPTAL